jgi:uncharacterized protein
VDLIENTIAFVQKNLGGADGGHDWYHIERVWKTARYIRKKEGAGDLPVIELGALLHDISDPKFNGGDEKKGGRMAYRFLRDQGVEPEKADHIRDIIQHVSFKGGIVQDVIRSIEFQIVQDADRLDAIGAIGIARAFNYGGFKNRPLHIPGRDLQEYSDSGAYYRSDAPTINHFYEKLLKLKDLMNTATGRELAGKRHAYMLGFLEQFYSEWDP